jgi:hypothetical protein
MCAAHLAVHQGLGLYVLEDLPTMSHENAVAEATMLKSCWSIRKKREVCCIGLLQIQASRAMGYIYR